MVNDGNEGRSVKRSTMKHGLSYTPEYRAWQMMRLRCTNPENAAYADYGGRGIAVCERWLASPAHFIADMGPKPSKLHELDRADNDKGYTCGHCDDCVAKGATANCRWVTRKVNDRNRRSSRMVEFRGETRTLVEWCEILSLPYEPMAHRVGSGWTPERAFTEPVRPKKQDGRTCKISAETIQRVRDGHGAGASLAAIARETGVSKSQVSRLVRWLPTDAPPANTHAEGRAAA